MPIEVPSYDELMWPALQALKAMGGSASNEELLQKVIEVGVYPPDVQNFVHTDNRQTKLNYNLAWAKTYLKFVGAVNNSQRGVWSITEKGKALSESDVEAIPRQVRKKVYAKKKSEPTLVADAEPEHAEEDWQEKLLNAVMAMPPDGFERLSQRVLRESGFIKVQVTGRSGDGGIDGLGVLRVNLLSFQVSF